MKALIVYRVDRSEPSNIGVVKKLIGTRAGLEKCKFKVDYVIHDKNHIYNNEKSIYAKSEYTPLTLFKWLFYKQLLLQDFFDYDLFIIRYGISTAYFSKWLSKIRKFNPRAKIIIDMPTYPYAQEWKGIRGKIVLLIDKRYNRYLKEEVDYVLHSGEEESILNIQTIKFSNGINLKNIKPRVPKKHEGYNFLSVAKFQYWHGLDRLINGLRHYIINGGNDVFITLAGDGPYIDALKKLSQELDLSDYVFFVGIKSGIELESLFNTTDLGIGTLGMHRKGVKWDSSLKHREYIARGLPFLMSGQDVDVDIEAPFVYAIQADDSYVDIKALLTFIDRLDHEHVISAMRSYAESDLSWDVKMSALLKRIDLEKA